jgi:hypothetical protein
MGNDFLSQASRYILIAGLAGVCAVFASCGQAFSSPPPVKQLATDVHLKIGATKLKLPFIALDDFAYRKMSFPPDQASDRRRDREAATDLVQAAADPSKPLNVSNISIVVTSYGWNDADMRQRAMCPLLTQAWARSVCDDPWAPLRQALPLNRFRLIDLESDATANYVRCRDGNASGCRIRGAGTSGLGL